MFRRNSRALLPKQGKPERLVHDPLGLGFAGNAEQGGYYMPAWERVAPPDLAGAQLYAYEGVVLPPTALMGGGYGYAQMTFLTPPVMARAATLPVAYGIGFDTPRTQPLYDPTAPWIET